MPDDITPPKLANLIKPEHIMVAPPCEDRDTVVKALANLLVQSGRLTKTQMNAALKLIAAREAIGSTAIGGGVAMPHARVKFIKEALIAFALLQNGTNFKPLDGAAVRYVFLILTSQDDDAGHLALLRAITRFVKSPIHLKALASSKTVQDVYAVFKDYAS